MRSDLAVGTLSVGFKVSGATAKPSFPRDPPQLALWHRGHIGPYRPLASGQQIPIPADQPSIRTARYRNCPWRLPLSTAYSCHWSW